jgi:pyruvate dehydrogenase E1 component
LTKWRAGETEGILDGNEAESQEWLEAFDEVLQLSGSDRCEELISRLLSHASKRGVQAKLSLNTPYCNTVSKACEPLYPGDLGIWQAMPRQRTSLK